MKFWLAFGLSVIVTFVYAFLYYFRYCALDANAIAGIATAVFSGVLALFVVFLVLGIEKPEDLGKLRDSRVIILMALITMLTYISVRLFINFSNVLSEPVKICLKQ